MSSDSLSTKCLEIIYLIYMYKKDLALNNLQWLICHNTQPNHWYKYLPNPSAWAGCNKGQFSFSSIGCHTKVKNTCLLYYLSIAGGRIVGFIPFPGALALWEMLTVLSRFEFELSWPFPTRFELEPSWPFPMMVTITQPAPRGITGSKG